MSDQTRKDKDAYDRLLRLWILRILVSLGTSTEITGRMFNTAKVLGIDLFAPEYNDEVAGQRQMQTDLRKLHANAEVQCRDARLPPVLSRNIERLGTLLGLSDVDCRILGFVVMLKTEEVLADTARLLGDLSTTRLHEVVSTVLGLPTGEVRAALAWRGTLTGSGLLMVDRRNMHDLCNKLDMISGIFPDLMLHEEGDLHALFGDIMTPCDGPTLSRDDYPQLRHTLETLPTYLRRCLEDGRKGVNILLHGKPGTGKSQMTRVVAAELGAALYEVAREDDDGDPRDGKSRLRTLHMSQRLLAGSRALLLFDEVEDVFSDGGLFGISSAQKHKGWMNRTLEENPVPTLWLSNNIDRMDPAFIRRYDMVVEVKMPSRQQRERIVRQAGGDLLPEDTIARIAESEHVAPAVIARAAGVINTLRDELPADQQAQTIEWLIGETLVAQGHPRLGKGGAGQLPGWYDPAFLNVDTDLAALAEGIARTKSARLCLYGPPGTGKTAYGRWLAERLDAPLLVKRASDLISCWIGTTEKNIAAAFDEAEEDGAVLLIDEVDSFLQDRRNANRSWEVTQVNEFLTQMESYPGVFIASTNLVDGLDQAALRRFDLKLRFDYLASEQAWGMLQRQCEALGLPEPDDILKARLSRIDVLTPGDFAAVVRQHRFRELDSPRGVVEALEDECSLKEAGRQRKVGFV